MAESAPSTYILGVNSLPHVSVFQFNAENNQVEDIWNAIKDININFTLSLSEYYCNKSSSTEFYSWIGIGVSINKSSQLLSLQQELIETLANVEIRNAHGDNFFPHFTLGFNQGDNNLIKSMKRDNRLWNKEMPVYLALGKAGKKWQFEKILFQ